MVLRLLVMSVSTARCTPVSIARRRLVVLRRSARCYTKTTRLAVSIARRRLVVLRRGPVPCTRRASTRFNRPKAISGLATESALKSTKDAPEVSIARRRLVVLRPRECSVTSVSTFGFNRPKAISGLATRIYESSCLPLSIEFQSPEGD